MAEKPETRFLRRVRPLIDALPHTWTEKIQQSALRGTPDLLVCCNGRFVALEFKKDDRVKPSPLQRHQLERIQRANGIALVVSPENWESVFQMLQKLSETFGRDDAH